MRGSGQGRLQDINRRGSGIDGHMQEQFVVQAQHDGGPGTAWRLRSPSRTVAAQALKSSAAAP